MRWRPALCPDSAEGAYSAPQTPSRTKGGREAVKEGKEGKTRGGKKERGGAERGRGEEGGKGI